VAEMRLTDTFTDNFGLKALSLFLAVVLWLSVALRQEGEVRLTVPVALKNIPSQLAVAGMPPSVIEFEITGPKIDLMKLRKELLTATLDLKGVGEGLVSFTNLEKAVQLRSGLRVMRIQPSTIELKLVKSQKIQPVHPEP